ncbi:hypothetical protein [Sphingomonas jaspsi]|uniref:hypothetical protein n=1 Tax=Sphingomonas jaspsi TaxID=392409 RepID=UPI0004AF76F6|nr:hypothetical protein [Sphingomonas jaspsi]
MTKLFQADIQLYATVYFNAESAEDALSQLKEITNGNTGIEFHSDYQWLGDGVAMTGAPFDQLAESDEFNLSPAMTIADQELTLEDISESE